jgi:hypothetical protein
MFPIQLIDTMRRTLEGRILDDICWPGRRSQDLAPLCGRQVQAVRLLTGRVQQVSVQLEWPVFPDEPSGFLFRAGDVEGIRCAMTGGKDVLHVYLAAGSQAAFMHRAVDGRLAYDATVDELSEAEVEAVRWAATANGRRLPQETMAQILGIGASRARELSVVWTRSGLLESGGGRGHPRLVSERALALAGLG